ncbi:MAG: helix-turn-helix domain-containing protein [Clostridiales bacterium]|nr:helix-turn-helix domain-containing protein [Clostridiales bacterium]
MNQIAEESLLFDFYGSLLTDKKQKVMRLYHEENMSLSEIAEDCGISRAAVYDSLKKAEKQLQDYENKLGMVASYFERLETVKSIRQDLQELKDKLPDLFLDTDQDAVQLMNDMEARLLQMSEEI